MTIDQPTTSEEPATSDEPPTSEEPSVQERRAVRELQTRGYTILDRRVPADTLAAVRTAFDVYLDQVVAEGDPRRLHDAGINRANVWVPLEEPYLAPDVVADPVVLSVIAAVIGDTACTYYASDTAFPGSDYQPAHADEGPLFPGLGMALPPVSIVCDVPLVDFRADNGPLEIWDQGTHLLPDIGVVPDEPPAAGPEARQSVNQRWAERMGATRVLIPAGSFLLRDTRVWHRGTPNTTRERRSMLALVYSRPWHASRTLPMEGAVFDALDDRRRRLFRNVSLCRHG